MQDIGRFLNKKNIRFLVIGGIAAIRYGAPRATRDLDILLKAEDIPENFLDDLEAEGYSPVEGVTMKEFLDSQYTIFSKNGGEVDLWTEVEGLDLDDEAWGRREDEEINSELIHFVSAEDLVVSKLALDLSGRDEIDAFSVLIARCEENRFDSEYFLGRLEEHNLKDRLDVLKERIGKIAEEDRELGETLRKELNFL